MNKSTITKIALITAGLGLAPSVAIGEAPNGLNIGDNDSIYVDGKSFQVIPGKAKGDAAAQIKNLAARDLGPAAIIIRSGDKLYIADARGQMAEAPNPTAAPNYAYDPRAYNPALLDGGSANNPNLLGGGSTGYNHNVATDYAYDPRAYNPALLGGGSQGYNYNVAHDFAYDPKGYYRPNLIGGTQGGPQADYAYDPKGYYRPDLVSGPQGGTQTEYAYDPKGYYRPDLVSGPQGGTQAEYAYDPRASNPALLGGGSQGYNYNVAHDYAYDPQRTAQPSIIYDPDYVEYRLKKAFEDNWTPASTK
jgi:hypothetical protein